MRMKPFRNVFSWVEGKENKWWSSYVFSLNPSKCFLLKMERKLSEEYVAPCAHFSSCLYFFFFLYPQGSKLHFSFLSFLSFFFFFFLSGQLPFFFLFLFFLGSNIASLFLFFGHDFYFLINLGDCSFFCVVISYLSLFCFN